MTRLRGSVAGALSGVTARNLVRAALDEQMPGGTATWLRTNFRGTRVSLMGGPALASGLAAGALATGVVSRRARVGWQALSRRSPGEPLGSTTTCTRTPSSGTKACAVTSVRCAKAASRQER